MKKPMTIEDRLRMKRLVYIPDLATSLTYYAKRDTRSKKEKEKK